MDIDRRRAPGVPGPGVTVGTVRITDVVDQKANGKRGYRLLEVDARVRAIKSSYPVDNGPSKCNQLETRSIEGTGSHVSAAPCDAAVALPSPTCLGRLSFSKRETRSP